MKKSSSDKLAYTIDSACAACEFTRSHLYSAIAKGELRSFKAGKRRMISARSLNEYVTRLERDFSPDAAA